MNPLIGELKNPFTGGRIAGKEIPPAAYHRQSVPRGDPQFIMGRGELMEFYWCPHRWLAGYEGESTKQTEWGSLVDCLGLTPNRFKDDFAVSPETYEVTKMECPVCGSITDSDKCAKCKTARRPIKIEKPWDRKAGPCVDWENAQSGKQIVKHETFIQAENAVKILYGKPETREVLECSEKQVMVVSEYHDPVTSVVIPCKILIDLLPRIGTPTWQSCIGDLKTTNSAGPGWSRAVWNDNYHVQAAFYLDLYAAATGEERTEWFFVIQESYPPWEPVRKSLSAEFIELGRWKYQAALQLYAKCLKTGEWPGYDGRTVEPEPWMLNTGAQ